jgi:hypothetical protein
MSTSDTAVLCHYLQLQNAKYIAALEKIATGTLKDYEMRDEAQKVLYKRKFDDTFSV